MKLTRTPTLRSSKVVEPDRTIGFANSASWLVSHRSEAWNPVKNDLGYSRTCGRHARLTTTSTCRSPRLKSWDILLAGSPTVTMPTGLRWPSGRQPGPSAGPCPRSAVSIPRSAHDDNTVVCVSGGSNAALGPVIGIPSGWETQTRTLFLNSWRNSGRARAGTATVGVEGRSARDHREGVLLQTERSRRTCRRVSGWSACLDNWLSGRATRSDKRGGGRSFGP
jgi:hypothetical protein